MAEAADQWRSVAAIPVMPIDSSCFRVEAIAADGRPTSPMVEMRSSSWSQLAPRSLRKTHGRSVRRLVAALSCACTSSRIRGNNALPVAAGLIADWGIHRRGGKRRVAVEIARLTLAVSRDVAITSRRQ